MTWESFRVDPELNLPVREDWAGFHLAEQRYPVQGTAYQLWKVERLTDRTDSRILEGMPLGPVFPTIDGFAEWLAAPEQVSTIGGNPITLAQAYVFAEVLEVAQSATLVDGRGVRGIRGAVEGLRWWRDGLRAAGRL